MTATVKAELDFVVLVRRHHSMVWRYLRLLGCERTLAEDLTQEAFLQVMERPFVEINDRATAVYLRRVAKHAFIDEMRRQRRHVPKNLDEADRVWDAARREDQGARWREALRECLGGLDPRPQQVLMLRYREGLEIRQVASRMGMKESGVKTLLGRIKARLRDCITRKIG